MDLIPLGPDVIHHIDSDDGGHSQLQKLKAEVEVALDIGSVHNVEDKIGLSIQNIIPSAIFSSKE